MKLRTLITAEEKGLFEECLGNDYQVLSDLQGDCYIENADGDLRYEECFGHTDSEYFRGLCFYYLKPDVVLKYFSFYLILDHEGVWNRGFLYPNGNYYVDCCAFTFSIGASTDKNEKDI